MAAVQASCKEGCVRWVSLLLGDAASSIREAERQLRSVVMDGRRTRCSRISTGIGTSRRREEIGFASVAACRSAVPWQ